MCSKIIVHINQLNLPILFHLQVLLVSSSKYPEFWIVPGGGVEPNETDAETAIREVLEEAGVLGRLGRCLGVFEVSQDKLLIIYAQYFDYVS